MDLGVPLSVLKGHSWTLYKSNQIKYNHNIIYTIFLISVPMFIYTQLS